MTDSQTIFNILNESKADLEFFSFQNSAKKFYFEKSDEILFPKKSGIFNRVKLIEKICEEKDPKLTPANLNLAKLHLEQFIVFEIYKYCAQGFCTRLSLIHFKF